MREPFGHVSRPPIAAVPTDHPCLPGHFPGRPIVPAVVVLDEVRERVEAGYEGRVVAAIEHAKFQDFVLPGRPFRITLKMTGESTVDFRCEDLESERSLVTGRIRLGPSERA